MLSQIWMFVKQKYSGSFNISHHILPFNVPTEILLLHFWPSKFSISKSPTFSALWKVRFSMYFISLHTTFCTLLVCTIHFDLQAVGGLFLRIMSAYFAQIWSYTYSIQFSQKTAKNQCFCHFGARTYAFLRTFFAHNVAHNRKMYPK